MKIFQAINEVMKSVPSIGKGRKNQQQGYNFRGIDDLYNVLNEHLAECGVFTTTEVLEQTREERVTKNGTLLIYSVLKVKFTFFATDGSSVYSVVIGEGMDSADKASNKAMSVAHKYALLQIFAIPTDEPKDPENDSHEIVGGKKTTPVKEKKDYNADALKGKPVTQKQREFMMKMLDEPVFTDAERDAFITKALDEKTDAYKMSILIDKVKSELTKRIQNEQNAGIH